MNPDKNQKTKQKFLDLLSLVFFSVFFVMFMWSLLMIAPASLPHDPAGLDGLVGFFGFIVLFLSLIPLGLAIAARFAYKKLTSQNQLHSIRSVDSTDANVIIPEQRS